MIVTDFLCLPPRLNQKIEAVQSEDEAYAADELVELGEEILSQLAAMGIAVYLEQNKQKEVFNDFLISLFLSNGHTYNAGPLYRWAANMLKEAEGENAELLKPFFWQECDGKEVLNEEIHHLASLRNAVMHGFFVLPPERNREELSKMEAILEKIQQAGLFEQTFGEFHFIDHQGFNGQWNITDPSAWELLRNCESFGQLAQRVSHEYSESFRIEEGAFARQNSKDIPEMKQAALSLLEKGKGALVCWYNPGSEVGVQAYRTLLKLADQGPYLPIHYALNDQGATYTRSFLERELGKVLFEHTHKDNAHKDPIKFLKNKDNQKLMTKMPVVILHNMHVALFNENHLTLFFNELFEAGVAVLGTSWNYPYLKRFFNAEVELGKSKAKVEIDLVNYSLTNYLRFKGPSKEQKDQVADYEKLKEIVFAIHSKLENKEVIVARRFADMHGFPIEFVHEAFGILSPFYSLGKEPFKQDEVDELYGFPKTIEESSRIFLTLGRRDVKLEYQHKVLIK
ncbi:MAG: hypothetical protein RL632_252 [Bacteroidota bacterium]|jgi:hypothetical protein